MKGAVYALVIVAFLIGVQAYEGIEPVSEPTPEAIYSALFGSRHIGHRIKNFNPHFIKDAEACAENFIKQDVKLLEIFSQGVQECLHLTAEQFQSLFDSGVYVQIAEENKIDLFQCQAASKGIEERVDCYSNSINQYVHSVGQVTSPYFRFSVSCLRTQVKQLESQWHTVYQQMIRCFNQVQI